MRYRSVIAAAILAILPACVSESAYHPPSGQKVHISQQTYQAFKRYQATIGSSHPGAFAVSESGRNSYYNYCEEVRCISGSAYGLQAVAACNNWGNPCYIFAYGNDVKVDYEVEP
jgi:hypothetical protein